MHGCNKSGCRDFSSFLVLVIKLSFLVLVIKLLCAKSRVIYLYYKFQQFNILINTITWGTRDQQYTNTEPRYLTERMRGHSGK